MFVTNSPLANVYLLIMNCPFVRRRVLPRVRPYTRGNTLQVEDFNMNNWVKLTISVFILLYRNPFYFELTIYWGVADKLHLPCRHFQRTIGDAATRGMTSSPWVRRVAVPPIVSEYNTVHEGWKSSVANCFFTATKFILSRSIPQQHLLHSLQEPVQRGVVAAVMHAHEQHAHVVQDVHHAA